jgi:hypothetical protein
MEQTKRINAKEYAEKLYPGQKSWIHIAIEAFKAGENNAIFMLRQEDKLIKELTELRIYKKDMERILYDPEALADLIGGL